MDGTSSARSPSSSIFNRAAVPARHAPAKREPAPITIGKLALKPAPTRQELPGDAPLLYEPPPLDLARTAAAPAPPPATTSPGDAPLLAILDAPLATGETAAAGFARKERELGAAFAALHVLEARTLHLRLANPRPGDVLADRFGRLTGERRQRLLTFLADARRRAAIAAARR